MLDLSTAVLCDFAQVRDRLLFVSSGAVSRLYRQELPSPLGLMVGLVIEVPLEDAGMDHRLRAEVINRHGTVLATLENLFRVSDAGLFPHEVQQVPLVLSITGVRARTWGTHQVRLYLDDELVRALTLYVVPAAGPQAVRPTPTQSRADDDGGSLGGTGTGPVDTGDGGAEAPAEPVAATPTFDFGGDADDEPTAGSDLEPAPAAADAEPAPAAADAEPEREPVSWGADADADAGASADEAAPAAEEPLADDDAVSWSAPTIDADPAAAPEDTGADDGPVPPDEPDPESAPKSRFAFRYRYEDEDT